MDKKEMEALLVMVDRFANHVRNKPKNPSRQLQRVNWFKGMVTMELSKLGDKGILTITT